MSQILDFRRPAELRPRPVLRGDETGEFWLEMPRHGAPDVSDNAPGRVLLEVFLVLAAATAFVAAVTFFVPAP
jgi:hypothetical protein